MGLTIILMFGGIEFIPPSFNNSEPGHPTGYDLAVYYIIGLFVSIAFNALIFYPTATGLEKFVNRCKSPRSRIVAGLLPLELLVLCVLIIGAIFVFGCLEWLSDLIPFLFILAMSLFTFSFYWLIFWLIGNRYRTRNPAQSGASDTQ